MHLRSFGKDWPRIQTYIQTKTHAQIRNFYQNYKYKLDLPGILQQRENDIAKKKKKEEKEAKKGKRKHKEMLKEQKRLKKLQKQQELEQRRQEEDERREKLKAKRQRANELAEEGTPDDKEKNGTSSKSSTGRRVGRPSGSGINGPRPSSINAKSISANSSTGLTLSGSQSPGSPLGATPRALKEVRRLFHTGRITPKTSPDGDSVPGIRNTIGSGVKGSGGGSSLNPNKK